MPEIGSRTGTSIFGLIVQDPPWEGARENPAAFIDLRTRTFKEENTHVSTSKNCPVTEEGGAWPLNYFRCIPGLE